MIAYDLDITEIKLRSDTVGIGALVFWPDEIKMMIIPKSVMYIDAGALHYYDIPPTVYYEGNKHDWDNISIDTYGYELPNTVYYFSATQPTEAGNWWYYDQNGKPAIWS